MKTKYSLSCLFVAALLAACDEDHKAPQNPDLAYPVVITAQAYSYDAQAGGTIWVGPDFALGVTFLKEGQAGASEVDAPHANVQYLANGISDEDYFVPADNQDIPYFPANGDKRHVAAYFPYRIDVIDQQLPVNLLAGKEYAGKLLFARVNNLDKDHRKCQLRMRPALSLITFRFKVNGPFTAEELQAMKVILNDFHQSGFFNTTDGTMNYLDGQESLGDIALSPLAQKKNLMWADDDAAEEYVFQGMVLPSLVTDTYSVTVECKGRTYTKNLSKENIDELIGSYEYTFEPTFTADGEMMLNCQSAPIINWKPGDGDISGDGEEVNS